jgi:hypothetical protein
MRPEVVGENGTDMINYVPPSPPEFEPEMASKCRSSGDFRPMWFEWYRHVGKLAWSFFCSVPESEAFRTVPPLHFAILVGSLNRCARLMLANMRLASDAKHGEATSILDRCIFETAAKVIWLCADRDPNSDRFQRFLADGLKRDLEFKQRILENVAQRGWPGPR